MMFVARKVSSRWSFLPLCTLVFLCCGQHVRQSKSMVTENDMTSNDQVFSGPTIRASARRDGDKIVVEYSIHNSYELEIYVFDQMIRYEGNKPVVDPTTAYAFFEEPGTIRLVRATLRLPMEKEVRVIEIPFA